MTDFWTAFDNHAATASASHEGMEFGNSNFDFSHTGGGCTAWTRMIDDTGHQILITDSSGCDAFLSQHESDADYWIIGVHGYDGGWVQSRQSKTVTEAIAIADELHRLVIAEDWAALDGPMAELPLGCKP